MQFLGKSGKQGEGRERKGQVNGGEATGRGKEKRREEGKKF